VNNYYYFKNTFPTLYEEDFENPKRPGKFKEFEYRVNLWFTD